MNENPGGTPNPLNPNPAQPSQPQTMQPVTPAPSATQTAPVNPVNPIAPTQPIAPVEPVKPSEPVEQPIPTPSAEPKDSIVEPKKKSKKGLIIALVILLIVAICGAAAAAIMILNPFGQKDAVPAAISKLLSGETPQIAAVNGSIAIAVDDSAISSINIDLSAGLNNTTAENYISAAITAEMADGTDFSFNADEVKVSGGDLYFKISGLSDMLNDYKPSEIETEDEEIVEDETLLDVDCMTSDCIEYEEEENPLASILGSADIFEAIDDEWLRISSDTLGDTAGSVGLDQSAQCLIGAASEIKNYGSDFKDIYNKNSFVTSSTENLKITKKKDDLYRLGVDTNKLTGFINGIGTTTFMNDLSVCISGEGTDSSEEITSEEISELAAELPIVYVEIDKDNNFTRLYLTTENDAATVTADVSLSYPSSITVEEPESYTDLEELLTSIFMTMFDFDYSDDADDMWL